MDHARDSPFSTQYAAASAEYYRSHQNSPYATYSERSGSNEFRTQQNADDETNPLFISAVRIFLEYVREKHGVAYPEKDCSLEQLIHFLEEFQGEARTKKGETYSPSTIRVIRYSLNRVIALGKNQQEMRPYPTQSTGVRKRRRNEGDGGWAGGSGSGRSAKRAAPVPLTMSSKPYPFETGATLTGRSNQASLPAGRFDHRSTMKAYQRPTPNADAMEFFRIWLQQRHEEPAFERRSKSELNHNLVQYYRSLRSQGLVRRSQIQTFRLNLINHLKDYGVDIERDPVFAPSVEAYRELLDTIDGSSLDVKPIPREVRVDGHGVEWLGIPVEYIKNFYRSGALSTADAGSLQRKVWFELTIFFRGVPCCPDQIYWNKAMFKVALGDQGVKYVALNPELYSRYGSAITRRGEEGRIMVERVGSPYCPVASFELYLSCMDPENESLFPTPLDDGMPVQGNRKIYSRHSSNGHLANMMTNIARVSHAPFQFSNLSAMETDHMSWMRAVTALELETDIPVQRSAYSGETAYKEGSSGFRGSVIQAVPARAARARSSSVFESDPYDGPSSFLSRNISGGSELPKVEIKREPVDYTWNRKSKLLRYSEEERQGEREPSPRTAALDEVPITLNEPFNMALRSLQAWSAANRRVCNLAHQSETDLDDLFVDFLDSTVSHGAEKTMLQAIVIGIDRALADVDRTEISMKSLPRSGKLLKHILYPPHHDADTRKGLDVDELKALYRCGIFDPIEPPRLQYKLAFELYLHFHHFVPDFGRSEMWDLRRFELIKGPNEQMRIVACDRTEAYIEARPGDRNCPVTAFRRYRELFDRPDGLEVCQPGGKLPGFNLLQNHDIASFLRWISKEAKLQRTLLEQDVQRTSLSDWKAALDALVDVPLQSIISPNISILSPSRARCGPPGPKRILENYRKAALASEDESEASSPGGRIEEAAEGDQFDVSSATSSPRAGHILKNSDEPLIIVRPQIVVINASGAKLERNTLKNLISEALLNSTDMPAWDNAIDQALNASADTENADSGYYHSRRGSFSGAFSQNPIASPDTVLVRRPSNQSAVSADGPEDLRCCDIGKPTTRRSPSLSAKPTTTDANIETVEPVKDRRSEPKL